VPISYTHYWRITDFEAWQESWLQVVADVNLIVKEAGIPFTETGSDDIPPTLDVDDGIFLNGAPAETTRRSACIWRAVI
jgi:hypothetical protein